MSEYGIHQPVPKPLPRFSILTSANESGTHAQRKSTGVPEATSLFQRACTISDENNSSRGGAGGSPSMEPEKFPVTSFQPISLKLWQQKQKLPIYAMRKQFLEVVQANQVIIVKGETGSGKSTQLTQYLYEAGFGTDGKIGCTQPRRIAAKSLAERVAEEMGANLGDQVGYKIRFDYKAGLDTSIVYMTDGILLYELAMEPNLYSYSAIILDEAHERLLHTDILLGLLKSTAKRRPDLKLIIASATLDCGQFSKYFDNAVIFDIPGRTFPVKVLHEGNPVPDYINACLSTIKSIHRTERAGDILVFLPGQQEIEQLCDQVTAADAKGEMLVLPCYSSLTMEEQNRVFDPVPAGIRKIVVATNIAETSLTIDGIVYVVDSGVMKERKYNPATRMSILVTQPITQAQAIQRSGRAGRTQPGKAFRLYSETFYFNMQKAPQPEIQRSNLESNILLLAANGVENIFQFDFLDPPSHESIRTCLTELEELQALDSRGRLTSLGRQMSRLPLDPRLAKMLITSVELNCSEDIMTIVSLISVQSSAGRIFTRSKKFDHQAKIAKARFLKPDGDYATLLNVYNCWNSNNRSEEWCIRNFINFEALEESINIRSQLQAIMQSNGLLQSQHFYVRDPHAIQKSVISGYFSQVARKSSGFGFRPYSSPNDLAFIHPGSALFKNPPKWIIYEELMNTGRKPNLMNVLAIEPHWIEQCAPGFYRKLVQVLPAV